MFVVPSTILRSSATHTTTRWYHDLGYPPLRLFPCVRWDALLQYHLNDKDTCFWDCHRESRHAHLHVNTWCIPPFRRAEKRRGPLCDAQSVCSLACFGAAMRTFFTVTRTHSGTRPPFFCLRWKQKSNAPKKAQVREAIQVQKFVVKIKPRWTHSMIAHLQFCQSTWRAYHTLEKLLKRTRVILLKKPI